MSPRRLSTLCDQTRGKYNAVSDINSAGVDERPMVCLRSEKIGADRYFIKFNGTN